LTGVIDRAPRLATVKTPDREIVLRDVPVSESPTWGLYRLGKNKFISV
jgi:hypothetical protein